MSHYLKGHRVSTLEDYHVEDTNLAKMSGIFVDQVLIQFCLHHMLLPSTDWAKCLSEGEQLQFQANWINLMVRDRCYTSDTL